MTIPTLYWKHATTAEGIVQAVERAVTDHAVVPGDRLPTVRELAERLGVAPGTVAAAYKALGARGIVTSHGRNGTRVSAGPALPSRPAPAVPPGTRNLVSGNPDLALLPDWTSALSRLAPRHLTYGEAEADLDRLIARARAQFRDDAIETDHVVVLSGALDGVERVLTAHLRPGDRVAIEDPGFPRVYDLVAALGLIAVPVKVDDEGPVPTDLADALRAGVSAVIVTPRAQNPTGAALTPGRARALHRHLAAHPDVLIIEDDHAGPIAGPASVTLTSHRRSRWAVVRSVAKSLGPDLRVALLAADRATLDRVEGRLRLGPGWVSHVLQQLVIELWDDPKTTKAIERARVMYEQRRNALIDALAGRGIEASGASGLNVWVPVPEEEVAIGELLTRGWAVAGGSRFRLHTGPALRITTATLEPKEARQLAADVAAAIHPTKRLASV